MPATAAITLDFHVGEDELGEMHEWWLECRDDAFAYSHYLFNAPVTFKIDGVEFLESLKAPMLSVAYSGLRALDALPRTGVEEFHIRETSWEIVFRLQNNVVEVSERSWGKSSARVNYEVLRDAWRDFAERVRRFIVGEFPEVLDREDEIGAWFREPKN